MYTRKYMHLAVQLKLCMYCKNIALRYITFDIIMHDRVLLTVYINVVMKHVLSI